MKRISRRTFIATGAASAALLAKSAAAQRATPRTTAPDALVVNDASKLNPIKVARNIVMRTDDEGKLIEDLRALLKEAAQDNRPVAIGGARHSMGGQSIPRGGVTATLAAPMLTPDTANKTYRVRSGARWRDVIAKLDPIGFSPAVMQSNHDFAVGGTLSVNAHGWPVPFGPFGATVRSFRLMLADGTLLTCSRTDNEELFRLVTGGYGLLGVIIDAELDMAENALLVPKPELFAAAQFAGRFTAVVKEPDVRMAYGRLSVARDGFFGEALLTSYRPAAPQPKPLPPPDYSGVFGFLSRRLFRAQTGSEAAKKRRWYTESVLAPKLANANVTRNTLLNYPVVALADTVRTRTDILHEYFVPPERFNDFVIACRETIVPSKEDLLNVTLRWLDADDVSMMAFAPAPRIAAVMLFPQSMTAAGEEGMRAMTERLIDRVIAIGGSFYLPYRLHARRDQVSAAYPKLDEFLAKKRHYDPQLRFRNLMWDKYFA